MTKNYRVTVRKYELHQLEVKAGNMADAREKARRLVERGVSSSPLDKGVEVVMAQLVK